MTVALPFQPQAVADASAAFPEAYRSGLDHLRTPVFETAAASPEVGPLTGTPKWGQPACLTEATGPGTTIRLGVPKGGGIAFWVQCRPRVMPRFLAASPDAPTADGTRGAILAADEALPEGPPRILSASALLYRLMRSARGSAPC